MADAMNCHWIDHDGDDVWYTDCGESFQLDEGTPESNGWKFCGFCGKPLIGVRGEYSVEEPE